MGRVTTRRQVRRFTPAGEVIRPDTLVVEEPLELRVNGRSLTVTMRTPGDDVDLAHGFLLAESMIRGRDELTTARYCDGVDETGSRTYNQLDIDLTDEAMARSRRRERNFVSTSACGVCGLSSIDDVQLVSAFPPQDDPITVTAEALLKMPATLRGSQRTFEATGGLHAAGLFTPTGELVVVREDVGRHNAVDKAIGWALREGRVPLTGHVLIVSGRASFELVQKAAMAGIPVLGAVSAPSSLAVDLAERVGMTLAGFLREETMNVYARPERVVG